MIFDNEETTFDVVVNGEKQYSIWPRVVPLPRGWSTIGRSGNRRECLDYIGEVWTDMQPASLQEGDQRQA
jgi:MbtH protein